VNQIKREGTHVFHDFCVLFSITSVRFLKTLYYGTDVINTLDDTKDSCGLFYKKKKMKRYSTSPKYGNAKEIDQRKIKREGEGEADRSNRGQRDQICELSKARTVPDYKSSQGTDSTQCTNQRAPMASVPSTSEERDLDGWNRRADRMSATSSSSSSPWPRPTTGTRQPRHLSRHLPLQNDGAQVRGHHIKRALPVRFPKRLDRFY
jgi:hypothetical protein